MPPWEQCGVKGLAQGPNSSADLILAAPGIEPPTLRIQGKLLNRCATLGDFNELKAHLAAMLAPVSHGYLRCGWAILLRGMELEPALEAGRGRPLRLGVVGVEVGLLGRGMELEPGEREWRPVEPGTVLGPRTVGLT